MTQQTIPVDAKRKDWPRLVASQGNDTSRKVSDMRLLKGLSRAKLNFLYG